MKQTIIVVSIVAFLMSLIIYGITHDCTKDKKQDEQIIEGSVIVLGEDGSMRLAKSSDVDIEDVEFGIIVEGDSIHFLKSGYLGRRTIFEHKQPTFPDFMEWLKTKYD